ncbi:MAG: helix-turn-helix domain-containing protein [Ruminococcaceae bacterium]|nr:helix-turn-helix domain-containing protein [Oscillospiraceae bacterium]
MKQCIYKCYEELPIVLSAKEIAAALCISRSGAYGLLKSEGFPSVRVGNRVMVGKAAFIKWLEREEGQ